METVVVDATYRGSAGVMMFVLLATAIRAGRVRGALADPSGRTQATATMLTALGVGSALVIGVGLDALRVSTGDLFYQQVHFAAFYVGFALVLRAADLITSDDRRADPALVTPTMWRWVRFGLWAAYAVSVAIALAKLLAAGNGTPGHDQRVPQQVVYYLPVFCSLAIAAIAPLALAARTPDRGWRRRVLVWFGAFAALSFVGMLREATIIPSTEPLVDVVIAFGPFTAGTICLYMSCRAVAGSHRKATVVRRDDLSLGGLA